MTETLKDRVSKTPLASVFPSDAWIPYQVTLTFTGKLVGGNPGDPELIEGWLKSNLPGVSTEEELRKWTIEHLAEVHGIDPTQATDADIEKALRENALEKKAQVFKRTSDGRPYIEGRQIKAMLKESTSIAFPRGENKWGQYRGKSGLVGGKEPRSYVAERVFIPEQPYVVAQETNGYDLEVGHIKDWRGESRSTLGYFEYVLEACFSFMVEVLDDCLSHEQWSRIWQTAERNGLGARRSQGAGQFLVTEWKRL